MRVNSMVVAGSPLIVCIDPKRQDQTALAEKYLTNKAIMSFARINGPFTPVEGATGSEPSDIYIYHHGKDDYLGVFNFTGSAVLKSIDLQRAGLDVHATYRVQDLWTGQERQVSGKFNIELGKNESTTVKLTRNATVEP